MKFIINALFPVFILMGYSTHSFCEQINVYLKFGNHKLAQEIQQFNAYLDNHGVFSKYDVRPFLENHPLHITLYLADYNNVSIEKLKTMTRHLARKARPITLELNKIYATSGSYVMLSIKPVNTRDVPYSALQELSDKTVINLAPLRDPDATIPVWAANLPEKIRAFRQYGSPGVFFEYEPHFTLMAKNFAKPETAMEFQQDMQTLIGEYHFPQFTIDATEIAVGYVDEYGQIIEEIASYSLK